MSKHKFAITNQTPDGLRYWNGSRQGIWSSWTKTVADATVFEGPTGWKLACDLVPIIDGKIVEIQP